MSALDQNLQKINKFITLRASDRQINTPHYLDCLKSFIDLMKEKDPFFQKISRGIELAGSYVDNLKVSSCDEYDTIIILKLPLFYDDVKITPDPDKPGFVQINISNCTSQGLNKIVDNEGYILQDKIQSWFESAITSTLNTLQREGPYYILNAKLSNYFITYRKSGPAHTFCIKFDQSNKLVSLDIVPVLQFDENHWMSTKPIPRINSGSKITWLAVAKPDKELYANNRAFLTSYQSMEAPYINDRNTLKNLIRLFKKLRDTQNIANLKSYYIKTVFLHKVEQLQVNNENADFWNKSLGALFIIMFKDLLEYLNDEELPYFWDERFNLLEKFTSAQRQSMHRQLLKIKNKIVIELEKNNPDYIIEVFLTEEEIEEYNTSNESSWGCVLA